MTSLSSDKIMILKFFINLYKLEWQWPFSKLTDEQMDKVRRIVHQKLKPFHFQMKSYYLYGANYPTDNPSPVWKRPMFARENENMLNKLFGPDGIWLCVYSLFLLPFHKSDSPIYISHAHRKYRHVAAKVAYGFLGGGCSFKSAKRGCQAMVFINVLM